MSDNADAFRFSPRRFTSIYQEPSPPVIQNFLKTYRWNHWQLVAKAVKRHLEAKLGMPADGEATEEGVQAVVLYRGKQKESLSFKLRSRHAETKFKSVEDIAESIQDFAGVRVILIIPSPRQFKKVDRIIKDLFGPDIDIKEHVGGQVQQPKDGNADGLHNTAGEYQPTHRGYQGTHYRTKLDKTKHGWPGEYAVDDGDKVEIQVTSALGHAWAEAGHDILYKSHLYGKPSHQEQAIYDALNGLVTSGNMLLTELHSLTSQRSWGRFHDSHALESYLGKLDLLQDDENPNTKFADMLPRELTDIVLRVLRKCKQDYPMAVRRALTEIGYHQDGNANHGTDLIRQFKPSFEPSPAMQFGICLMLHVLKDEFEPPEPAPDPKQKCCIMMSALCFLQTVLGYRYEKGCVGQFLFEKVGVEAEVQSALSWMVDSGDRYVLLKDATAHENPRIERKTRAAWPWFVEQAQKRSSICGFCFRLAADGLMKPFELNQTLYELDNMGPVSRRSTGDDEY